MKLKGIRYLKGMYKGTKRVFFSKEEPNVRTWFEFKQTKTQFIIYRNHERHGSFLGKISIKQWNDYININMKAPYKLTLASAVKYAERYYIEWEEIKTT